MFRIRSLIVASAAAALTVTGASAASAAPADRGHDVRAQIVSISDHARVDDWGKVKVEATYKCWGKGRDVTTSVTLTQRGGAYYDARVKSDLRCDGKRHTQTVKLDRESRARVHNGSAKVVWEYSTWKRGLDKDYAWVDVKGARGHH